MYIYIYIYNINWQIGNCFVRNSFCGDISIAKLPSYGDPAYLSGYYLPMRDRSQLATGPEQVAAAASASATSLPTVTWRALVRRALPAK